MDVRVLDADVDDAEVCARGDAAQRAMERAVAAVTAQRADHCVRAHGDMHGVRGREPRACTMRLALVRVDLFAAGAAALAAPVDEIELSGHEKSVSRTQVQS
jgi:hypothetical protein